MKVVYRSMLREIERAVEAAKVSNRTIEHIELTPTEYSELMQEAGPYLTYQVDAAAPTKVYGVKIKRIPLEPAR